MRPVVSPVVLQPSSSAGGAAAGAAPLDVVVVELLLGFVVTPPVADDAEVVDDEDDGSPPVDDDELDELDEVVEPPASGAGTVAPALFLGVGVPLAKSSALLSLSSPKSRPVVAPPAIFRFAALVMLRTPNGGPAGALLG